jgi:hypothetical protein
MWTIDLETWPRRGHFELFRDWDYPHLDVCADIDPTAFLPAVKRRSASPTKDAAMRIAIIAPGSRGDVQPYIALGKGLAKAGHGVRLVPPQDFDLARTRVVAYGRRCAGRRKAPK